MIFPAAGLDGLTSLDVQQPGPLIDNLLEMLQHLAGIAGQFHGLGHVAPGPTVVLALDLGDAQDSISCVLGKSEHARI